MNTNIKHIILLIIRLLVGGFIAYHAYLKVIDIDGTITALGQYFGLSASVVWLVTIGEVLASLGIIFGVFTQVAAAGAAIIMAGAVYYTKGASMEPIWLLLGSLILIYTGSGRYALRPCSSSVKDTETN